MNIQINIKCHCCDAPISIKENSGVVINRIAFLQSQIIGMNEQIDRLQKRKQNVAVKDQIDNLNNQIKNSEKELKLLKAFK